MADPTSDRLASFFSSCPEMLFITDREGAILHLSASLARLLGPGMRQEMRLAERVHPDDRRAFDAAWVELGQASEPVSIELRLEGSDGVYQLVSCRAQGAPERGEIHGSLREDGAERVEKELQARFALIESQQRTISALSTPIIEVWDRALALPMLGVVDSTGAAEVMENLLARTSQTRARFTILDLTGVNAMDTATAVHVFKLIQAIRLLGAEGIITGIQPGVAQTMITLGIDLGTVKTLANMREAIRFCMTRSRDEA